MKEPDWHGRIAAALAVAAVLIFISAPVCLGADSFTITPLANIDSRTHVTKFSWKADGSGDKANETIPAGTIKGRISLVVVGPGSTAPASGYDLVIADENGCDILNGTLADLSDTIVTQHGPSTYSGQAAPRPISGPLTVSFTEQATADCDGVFWIYYED